MKYICLIHQGTALERIDAMGAEEKQAVYAGYGALNASPGVTPGERMDSPETASTVRVEGDQTLITDGPFAELKEAIGGYFFVEADDLDAAIAIAAIVPAARLGGAVEVRPLVEAQW